MKRGGCFRNILIGIGVLILLGFCVSILGRDDKQEVAQLNNTQVAGTVLAAMTQTIEAEATQAPIDVPDEPISEVEEYATELYVEAMMCGTSTDTLGQKFLEMGENVELMYDSNYVAGVHADIDDFELYCTNFYDENAPAEFSEMNNILNEADINYLQTAIHLRSGIDTFDIDKLLAAANYMNVGTEKLTEAGELAENMNQ